MSQSPLEDTGASGDEAFAQRQQALWQMLLKGRSWSGHERHCCFLNTGDSHYTNISYPSGLDFPDDGRGVAVVDWDLDGDLDLWMTSRIAPQVRFLRNGIPRRNHFLALRLVGQTCNRDAIGARVNVFLTGAPDRPLIQTVKAGEGFLSQSSKWLHFGLGESADVGKVTVRWPGGETETLKPMAADRHYRVVQGEGVAVPWPLPRPATTLAPSRRKLPPRPGESRMLLSARYPVAPIVYINGTGESVSLAAAKGQPVWLNLWASWCQPCLKELSEFVKHRQQLDEAGLHVVAISVDRVDKRSSEPGSAERVLERLAFPFSSGYADESLLGALQAVADDLLAYNVPLPVPSSFLFDARGELAAIYKGPVSVGEVLSDVRRLRLSREHLLQASLPFEGHWFSKVVGIRSHAYTSIGLDAVKREAWQEAVDAFGRALDSRQDAEAHKNLGLALAKLGKVEAARDQFQAAAHLKTDDATIQFNLAKSYSEEGKLDDSIRHYREAVRIDPDYAEAHNNLALEYLKSGNGPLAVRHAEMALSIRSDFFAAHFILGKSLLQDASHMDEAIVHLRQVTQIRPDFADGHMSLAIALKLVGQLDAALKHFREAARLRPNWLAPVNSVAWILATHPDAKIRDPKLAVSMAERLAEATDHGIPGVLDTLAAAYASAGQFGKAVQVGQTALRLATDSKAEVLARRIGERLERYRQDQPFLERLNASRSTPADSE